ncbi:hypothetical protein P3T76_009825 [Phytophthora citrophthora]|uniref:Crinkler effector protein N-terminal domain-containing protein n=1 Tax=Phytophthora citrophthora TaxID=4793 RepID=A0AAD9GEV0_9STRA|nr:hypothetical protein P3T76_009825 [Phytophthora citrophthora]
MTKLFCAIVGISGSVFSVDIDLNQSVENLKVAIKSQSDRAITVPLPKIQLYLAKKGNLWLKDDDTLDSILQSGDVTSYEKMHVSWELNKSELFESGTSLGKNAIHVLVVISETQTISPSAGDRKRSASSGIAEEKLLSVVKCGLKLSDTDVAAGRLLEVPKHFMGIDIYDGLYVRQEYWDLHALITEKFDSNRNVRRVPVLGSPGIGKSVFGGVPVSEIDDGEGKYCLPLYGRSTHLLFYLGRGERLRNISGPANRPSYISLFDENDAIGGYAYSQFHHLYLFASPYTSNYNNFSKQHCFMAYMNPWTKKECAEFADAIHLDA